MVPSVDNFACGESRKMCFFLSPEPIGESLLTSLFTFLSLAYDLPNKSSGRIYELNARIERAD